MDTSPELDLHLCTERNRAYKGRAKVQIRWLSFEDDLVLGTRPLDPKNVARLVKIFELEGCFRREPEHYVPALIRPEALNAALTQANHDAGKLFAVTEEPVSLELSSPLICLHGRHRLEAAKLQLEAADKWWVVDLYLDDIHDDAKAAIREEYSNSRNFSDGDIFRNLRYHQMRNNKQGASKWMARLSESKRRDVIQLRKMASKSTAMGALSKAFDDLLPYIGLWSALQLGTFHRLLTLRCPEELTRYLHLIKNTWNNILGGTSDSRSRLDANTVRLLQTRCLCYSSKDNTAVTADMKNGVLFPNIPDQTTRGEIMVRLETIGHMIPSLHTFLEDTKYLEPCAKIVKSLLPPKFKGTIYEAYEKNHTGIFECQIQKTENRFTPLVGTLTECIWIAYRQIWLFAMRHFPDMIGICPRKDEGKPKPSVHHPDENLWHKIAELARKCGFQTSEIAEYLRRSPSHNMASKFLAQCRPPEYYNVSTTALNRAVNSIVSILQDIQPRTIDIKVPPLTSDYQDNMDVADRCGRPFEQSFLDDKKYLFYNSIYNKRSGKWTLAQRERYLTSFKVKQDIFIAFFGRSDKEPEDPSSEERALNNVNMMNLQNQDMSSRPSQTPVNTQFTGAPPLNTSGATNVPAAQTHSSQALIPAHQNISGSTFHAGEAINNNRRSEERIASPITLGEGTSLATDSSTVSPWSIQSTRPEEPNYVEEAGKRRRLDDEEHEKQARPVTALQVLPEDGIVQTEETMSNNEQSEASTVTNEGTEGQEERSHDEYAQKRQRTNSEIFEETSKPSTSADSPEATMLDKDTPGTRQWSEDLAAFEAANSMLPAGEGIPSSRPVTQIQTGASQQQAVTSSSRDNTPEVSMFNQPTPTLAETEAALKGLVESDSVDPTEFFPDSLAKAIEPHPKTIPEDQLTSEFVKRYQKGPTDNSDTTIHCIATDTRRLIYVKNGLELKKWYFEEKAEVQFLTLDASDNIQIVNADQALDIARKYAPPMILYELKHHPAGLQSRKLVDLDTPDYRNNRMGGVRASRWSPY